MEYFGVAVFDVASKLLESWCGRRGSNPRPTAWKAVTLPLSYSRWSLKSTAYEHCKPTAAPMAPFPTLSFRHGRLQQIHCPPSALQGRFGVHVLVDIDGVPHLLCSNPG